jgi:hypothetical protein
VPGLEHVCWFPHVQSGSELQPHAEVAPTVTQAGLVVTPDEHPQALHTPPVCPQLALSVPGWHVWEVELQHPPLHAPAPVPVHVVPHWPAVQALPIMQSLGEAHPHVPLDKQARSLPVPLHAVQSPPSAPHAPASSPGWQLPPPQHPPLHWPAVAQVLEQDIPIPGQAKPGLQSVGTWHPHVPPARQIVPPADELGQTEHIPPPAPHAPGAPPG